MPKAIETEDENEKALAIIERLMMKPDDKRSVEEDLLLELLAVLVERFEESAYPMPEVLPLEALKGIMVHARLRAVDLVPEFGSRAKVSEVLNGKRSISKEQAKRLGQRFKVSPALFICTPRAAEPALRSTEAVCLALG